MKTKERNWLEKAGDEQPMNPPMSLRDYFAAAAVNGLLSDIEAIGRTANEAKLSVAPMVAKMAYDMADAMIAEREKVKVQS